METRIARDNAAMARGGNGGIVSAIVPLSTSVQAVDSNVDEEVEMVLERQLACKIESQEIT